MPYVPKGTKGYTTAAMYNMKAIQKIKNVFAYSPFTCFIAADHWFLVTCVILKIAYAVVRRTLSRGKCRDSYDHGCAD